MKKVLSRVVSQIPPEEIWAHIVAVKDYSEIMPFTYAIKVRQYPLSLHSSWTDVTTVLWFPLVMKHTVHAFKENEQLYQVINLPFGGKIEEEFLLSVVNDSTVLEIIITFHPGSIPFSKGILFFWEKRMRYLVTTAVANLEKKLYSEKDDIRIT